MFHPPKMTHGNKTHGTADYISIVSDQISVRITRQLSRHRRKRNPIVTVQPLHPIVVSPCSPKAARCVGHVADNKISMHAFHFLFALLFARRHWSIFSARIFTNVLLFIFWKRRCTSVIVRLGDIVEVLYELSVESCGIEIISQCRRMLWRNVDYR